MLHIALADTSNEVHVSLVSNWQFTSLPAEALYVSICAFTLIDKCIPTFDKTRHYTRHYTYNSILQFLLMAILCTHAASFSPLSIRVRLGSSSLPSSSCRYLSMILCQCVDFNSLILSLLNLHIYIMETRRICQCRCECRCRYRYIEIEIGSGIVNSLCCEQIFCWPSITYSDHSAGITGGS